MRREEATWLVVEFLLLALAACGAEDPRGGAEGLARSLQKKVRCSPAGLSAFECVQCLSHESLADLPGWNSTSRTREGWQREQLSVLLLERLSDLSRPCNAGSARCDSYAECRSALRLEASGTNERLARLERILRRVKAVYVPTRRHKCFTAEDVLGSVVPYEKDQEAYVEKVAAAVVTHLSQGHCIEVGDAVTDFLEDLFKRYGDNSTEVMTQQGLERLLKKLRLASDEIAHGHSHGHDHDHDHDDHSHDSHDDKHDHDHSHDDHAHDHSHDHEHSHDHSHHDHGDQHSHQHSTHDSHQSNGTTADQTSTPPALSTSTGGHTHGSTESTHDHSEHHEGHDHFGEHVDPDDDHDEDKADHEHHHQPVVQAPGRKQSSQPALSRRRRSVPAVPELDSHNHTSSALKCWSPGELIRQFGRSENGTISRNEFFHLCPALIQQAVSDVCRQGTQATHRPTTAELYGYGTLSVFIISLCSLMGVLLLPCLARHAYYYIMMGFIGLSFGTMTGDALLHLIPQVLGLHSHEGGHEGGGHSHHHHDEDGLVPSYMWKQLGLIGAIYGLFVFEALSTIFGREEKEGHGHSHLPKNIPGDLHMTKVSSKTESNVELAHCSSTPSLATEESPQAPVFKSRSLCCGMSTLAAMVIIGGAIHNVADGLAIGAAFSSGLKSGLSTSLAVFCHELPHEFGDFVVLISTGLGYRRALFLNFLSALAAFGGLYAGFLLGEEAAARDWILTVTAGIFLYVALVDMLPELKQYRGKSPFKMFIVKNLGVLAGIAFMCVIAIYEDKLNI